MTLTEKLLAGISSALLITGVVTAVLYVQQVKATAGAEAYSAAKQEVIHAAEKRIEQREREWREREAGWEREKRDIKSAAQAVRVIEKYIPHAQGEVVQVQPEQLPQPIREKLPDSPGYTVMTEQASVQLGQDLVECQKNKEALQVCGKDKEDLRAQIEAAQQQRDEWRKVALGGSKAKRVVKAGVLGLCSAGGAAVGAGHGSKGAAIGALVGAVGCALLTR